MNLDAYKGSQNSDIQIKIVKENVDIFCDFVCTSFNSSVSKSKLPGNLKLADITHPYKKGKKDIKANYRPVSILQNLSKIFEKCIFKHIFSITYCESINVVLGKVSVPNIAFSQYWKNGKVYR